MKKYKRNIGKITSWVNRITFIRLTLCFAIFFLTLGFIFALIYWGFGCFLSDDVFSFNKGDLCFSQSLYFSFITQLTIGYGDFAPVACAQIVAIIQGILGVLFIGIWSGVFVAKWFASDDKESIYFAKWAGYSLADEKFFILFVNRNVENLVDTNINAITKLSGRNPLLPNINPPYIGKSVWPLLLERFPKKELAKINLLDNDGIKISISGTAGMTRCTNWKRYDLKDIYVLPDLKYYYEDKFTDPKFDDNFYAEFEAPHEPIAKLSDFKAKMVNEY